MLNISHRGKKQASTEEECWSTARTVYFYMGVYIYMYVYIYTHTEKSYKQHFCFCPHFSWAELKDLRLFLCTQKAYFSHILFTNLSKSVLVSTSPLPR